MKYRFNIICFLFFLYSTGKAQLLYNAEEAFLKAGNKRMAVLLIFSGSDWCQPCIRFEKTILQDSSFKKFAADNLVLLRADFPQRKKLSTAQVTQNEALAERYNPNGIFPLLLLFKPDKTILTKLEYQDLPAKQFINQIRPFLYRASMLKEYSRQEKLMGSAFEFIVVAGDNHEGEKLLEAGVCEVKRIEKLLSEFNPASQTSMINRYAGVQTTEVAGEVYELLQRCKDISKLTGGAFDITAGALKQLYNFKGENFVLPVYRIIRESLKKIGYDKIKLSPPNKVYMSVKGMWIGFGAIGKGYAADKVKTLLRQKGVQSGVINASGDLTAWGLRPDGTPWKVGIADPEDNRKILLWLPLNGMSVATSGNYIQYFEVNGIRHSHNIDPKTGYPVKGIKSATVISPGAELSDALATAVSVMGIKTGLYMINQLPQTHCIIVDEQNKMYSSKHISITSTI